MDEDEFIIDYLLNQKIPKSNKIDILVDLNDLKFYEIGNIKK